MTIKKTEEKEEKVNQPEGAQLAPVFGGSAPSREVLSHQYQANSPAINTNAAAGTSAETDSILDKIETPEKLKADKEAAKVREEQLADQQGITLSDYNARTKLDVSNPLYINPSLDHFKVKGK